MASITPVAYNPTLSPITGTTQVGDLAIGTTPQEYSGNIGNVRWWATPDQDTGYVVSRPISSINQPNPLGTTAGVAFWKSKLKTEESFLALYDYLAPKLGLATGITSGTTAAANLTAAGYWNSWVNTWQYDSLINLTWPDYGTADGFTKYTGGVTNIDDGYTNSAIVMPSTYEMAGQGESANLYVSTNGFVTIGAGSGSIISTPQSQTNPAAIAGNPADQWLQPGLVMTDGDAQDIYYKTIDLGGGKWGIQLKVYIGTFGANTTPKSYVINLYRDSQYQWVETRVKLNTAGNAGPYNISDVSQASSTTSKVWRGDLNGQNWVYMGTGSVQP